MSLQEHALRQLEWRAGNFGLWLEDAMGARGLSNRQVALRSGLTHGAVSRLRRGLVEPRFTTAVALMRVLK